MAVTRGKAGQIVLFKFPQTDLTTGKLRPALLLKQIDNRFGDWLTCMISTKTGQETLDLDNIIEATDLDFIESGLKSSSVFRVTRLAVISDDIPIGIVGAISLARLTKIKQNLAYWIEN
jgi:mRNA interferase MazF